MPKPLDRSATSQVAPDLLPSLVSVSGTTARGSVVGQYDQKAFWKSRKRLVS